MEKFNNGRTGKVTRIFPKLAIDCIHCEFVDITSKHHPYTERRNGSLLYVRGFVPVVVESGVDEFVCPTKISQLSDIQVPLTGHRGIVPSIHN